ncbi:MAG TPA: hypothetical protein VGR55_01315 [Candidatus Acidoferrum sp.]|nr:hypothetical protein [Candidatus Acidoferrum sp.]
MATARQIWEAGRKALGLDAPPTPIEQAEESAAEQAEKSPTKTMAEAVAEAFAAGTFDENREYRVTFKNGCGMDASGHALKYNFSLDPATIEKIEPA